MKTIFSRGYSKLGKMLTPNNETWENKPLVVLRESTIGVLPSLKPDGNIITSYCPETTPNVAIELLIMLTSEEENCSNQRNYYIMTQYLNMSIIHRLVV